MVMVRVRVRTSPPRGRVRAPTIGAGELVKAYYTLTSRTMACAAKARFVRRVLTNGNAATLLCPVMYTRHPCMCSDLTKLLANPNPC